MDSSTIARAPAAPPGPLETAIASAPHRLHRVVWPLLVIVPVVLGLMWVSMEVLSATRAAIAAQGEWSRAQKDAVVQLLRYAATQDPEHYAAFDRAMRVLNGERAARAALGQQPPDRATARAALLASVSAPEDVDKLVWLAQHHDRLAFVAQAAAIRKGRDADVSALQDAGTRLRALIAEGDAPPEAVAALSGEIQTIDSRLGPPQQMLSATLRDGFHTVQSALFIMVCLAALALLALAWLSARRMIARFVRSEEGLAQARRAASAEHDRALVTLQSIGDAVITADADGRIDYLNPVAEQVTGWSNIEARGRTLAEVVRIVDGSGTNPVVDLPRRLTREHSPMEIARDATLIRRDGSEVAIAESASRIRARSGEALGIVIVFRDVSRERRMAAQLSYHASHDALTGLVNRLEFERRLGAALHNVASENRSHVLLYLDLDRFKFVNDTCGHAAGDRLLQQLPDLFSAELRESDTLARLGGDEFGVLLENCSVDDALRIAEELRRRTENFRFAHQGHNFEIGVSIGVVPLGNCAPTVHDAMVAADHACYRAKEAGRNRVELYRSDADVPRPHGEPCWDERIAQAMTEDRFRLYAQKIVPLGEHTTEPRGIEIFVRMHAPDGGLVGPGAFIPAAERYGLMPYLDRWVIGKIFHLAAEHAHGEPPLFFINLSAASVADKHFADFVMEQFARSSLPAERVCFELTESTVMTNPARTQRFMEDLKASGCLFSLEEFGRGMASFSYARHLPVDFIKIDGMFVRNMVADAVDRAAVEAINRIGHVLGKTTIAETVQDNATLRALHSLGVDLAQGYAVSPVVELTQYLAGTKALH
jgi:diguanylate cyclase (GGDEF)-like protein/PAS domain S-box-containing protein